MRTIYIAGESASDEDMKQMEGHEAVDHVMRTIVEIPEVMPELLN